VLLLLRPLAPGLPDFALPFPLTSLLLLLLPPIALLTALFLMTPCWC
jgi:hypothetical protein